MANNEVIFDKSELSVIDMQFLEMRRETERIGEISSYLINKVNLVVKAVEALASVAGIEAPSYFSNLTNKITTLSNSVINNMITQVNCFEDQNKKVMQELSSLEELLEQVFDGDSYNIQVKGDSNSESEVVTFNELLKEYTNGQQVNTGTADIDSTLAPWTEEQKKAAAESGTILLDRDELLKRVLNKDEEIVEEDEKTASDIVTSEMQDKIHNAEMPTKSETDDEFLTLINRLNGRSIDSLSYEELYAMFTEDEILFLNDNYDNRCGRYGLKMWTRDNVTNPNPTVEVNPALFEDSLNTGNDYAIPSVTFEKLDINEPDIDWEQYTEDKYNRW